MKIERWQALFWISISGLFALSKWSSASVIIPELKVIWGLTPISKTWVTASVPIGFVKTGGPFESSSA
ncbi:hypothetical protein ACQKKK_10795 [Peribacillus sp. NPDC006672]|uniref:hypothetical protein n=1 Tax=Peribacillus sp. NPDC006672 TaxID=3390606 RepID=UPI003CFEC290